jgi:hypothetical protein
MILCFSITPYIPSTVKEKQLQSQATEATRLNLRRITAKREQAHKEKLQEWQLLYFLLTNLTKGAKHGYNER